MLRRAERAAVADIGGSAATTAVNAAPVVTKLAETGSVFADKGPSIATVIGVAAAMVVPAAVPVVQNHLTTPRAPAVAAPATPTGTSAGVTDKARPAVVAAGLGGDPAAATSTTLADGTTPSTTVTTTTPTTGATGTGAGPGTSTGTGGGAPGGGPGPAPKPRRSGSLAADDIVATTDQHTDVSGTMKLVVAGDSLTGTLRGTVTLTGDGYQSAGDTTTTSTSTSTTDPSGDSRTKAASAPKGGDVTSELLLGLEGGRVLRVELSGKWLDAGNGDSAWSGTYQLFDDCPDALGGGAVTGKVHLEDAPVASSMHLDFGTFAADTASLTNSRTCDS
jgi:hypothetical protein